MKKTRIILFGVVLLSALAFASCGSKKAKEVSKEGEKRECCEKKDTTSCADADSMKCEHKCGHKCAHEMADTTKK